jgi:hypothetical protein
VKQQEPAEGIPGIRFVNHKTRRRPIWAKPVRQETQWQPQEPPQQLPLCIVSPMRPSGFASVFPGPDANTDISRAIFTLLHDGHWVS